MTNTRSNNSEHYGAVGGDIYVRSRTVGCDPYGLLPASAAAAAGAEEVYELVLRDFDGFTVRVPRIPLGRNPQRISSPPSRPNRETGEKDYDTLTELVSGGVAFHCP